MKRTRNTLVQSKPATLRNKKSKKTCATELVQENTPDLPGLCKLPNELILTIMEYLSFYDNMSLSMTCVRFHNLINSFKSFNKNKLVKVSGENYDTFFQLFCSTIRNKDLLRPILTHIEFSACNIGSEHQKFWRDYGEYVKSIAFSHCECDDNGDDKILLRIFSNCPNLEEFKMIPASATCTRLVNVSSKLQYKKLKKIEISMISDYAFNNFIINSPKLEQMEISIFPQIPAEYKRVGCKLFRYKSIPIHENLNYKQLTYENFMGVLPLSNIISFGNKKMTNTEMVNICKLKTLGFKLEELSLSGALPRLGDAQPPNVPHDMIRRIYHTYQDSLKKLDITAYHGNFFDLHVLKNLETIKLPDYITSSNLLQIKELKNIKHLQLGKERFLVFALFVLEYMRIIPTYQVLKDLPNLQTLHINGADIRKIDLYLNSSTTGLKELHLKKCRGINMKKMFLALDKNHKSLRKLSLNKCRGINGIIDDDDICSKVLIMATRRSDAKIYDGISGLKNLEYLEITDTDITDKGVIEQFKWNQLKVLKFTGNKKLTDGALGSLSKHCPALIELSLSGCSKITNFGVNHLRCLQRLRKIDLTMTRVNSTGISSLVYSPCPLSQCFYDINILDSNRVLKKLLHEKLNHRLNHHPSVVITEADVIANYNKNNRKRAAIRNRYMLRARVPVPS